MEHEIDCENRDWEQVDREIRDWEKTIEDEIDFDTVGIQPTQQLVL